MGKILTIFVLCTLLYWQSFVDSSNLDGYLVTVEHVEFNGNGRFPENVDVVLGNQGNNVYLKLARDDDATNILSEEIFETSKILPSGVFSENDKDKFAAYTAGPSDLIVIHRQSIDDKPKLYGRFTNEGEKMVIQPDGGSYVHHRVRRENNEHTRVRRASDDGNVLELFVFADLSVYTHVRDEFMAPNATVKETKTFLKSYLNGIAKEVDFIFKKMGEDYGTNNTFRVYFQQYQIITKGQIATQGL
ncbi:uncharacterized protein LOC132719734 [Ruditapes philippinarum]|uniref:uncharacterized protein LOC132719734 n=1 Tax=Ruditapes philippinarum TaxID=129788 RepID=UPI00295B7CA9|nr:uncharacterized protein LOC132719734 [Ruditapes philippinarum]